MHCLTTKMFRPHSFIIHEASAKRAIYRPFQNRPLYYDLITHRRRKWEKESKRGSHPIHWCECTGFSWLVPEWTWWETDWNITLAPIRLSEAGLNVAACYVYELALSNGFTSPMCDYGRCHYGRSLWRWPLWKGHSALVSGNKWTLGSENFWKGSKLKSGHAFRGPYIFMSVTYSLLGSFYMLFVFF